MPWLLCGTMGMLSFPIDSDFAQELHTDFLAQINNFFDKKFN